MDLCSFWVFHLLGEKLKEIVEPNHVFGETTCPGYHLGTYVVKEGF
jgi:hypothetical protein